MLKTEIVLDEIKKQGSNHNNELATDPGGRGESHVGWYEEEEE
jgi:hypothetical protein